MPSAHKTVAGPVPHAPGLRLLGPDVRYESPFVALPTGCTSVTASLWLRTPRRYWKKHPVTVWFGPLFESRSGLCAQVEATRLWQHYQYNSLLAMDKAQLVAVVVKADGPVDIAELDVHGLTLGERRLT